MTVLVSHMKSLLALAFEEDIGTGDITAQAVLADPDAPATATIIAKQRGVLSGIEFAKAAFYYHDPRLDLRSGVKSGHVLAQGDTVLTISGPVKSILEAERVALNSLQYLSGIATLTATYVEAVEGTEAAIYDTRKTLPGWRVLAKQAVRHGGGKNHRMGLYDQFLIKENHIAACGGIGAAIAACRRYKPSTFLEVEVRTLDELKEAMGHEPDAILLDNFSIDGLTDAVQTAAGRYPLEASGGVNLSTVRAIAQTGVDRISVGALTHSAAAFDFSLLIESR